ncbi:hypothetical protein L1987_72838 [Smallanthus sonchifolius]|uniref:Uncharacterized protein n=1 Tax=Smallanthus sonchifolius TaxID=185202 RepID=A0ACB9AX05_9ASTR|nr:hypothetical protein L1987_72838 [Smallanthus sonchifolius]
MGRIEEETKYLATIREFISRGVVPLDIDDDAGYFDEDNAQHVFEIMVFIGSLLSIYGCCQHHNKVSGHRSEEQDEEQSCRSCKIQNSPNPMDYVHPRQVASFWGYVFLIMFQVYFVAFAMLLLFVDASQVGF